MSVLNSDNTVKILVINPTDKEVVIPTQKKLANISLLTNSVNAIGMSDSGEWWMVSDKTRSNPDTEQVKEEGDWAFRQQFLERIDADLDKEKKEQMLELLWVQ